MLTLDAFEPLTIETAILESLPDTERSDLNNAGWPDYLITTAQNTVLGVSRKQGGELIGGIDACEEQLSRDLLQVDHLYLLVEGMVERTRGGCWAYKFTGDKVYKAVPPYEFGYLKYERRFYHQSWKGYKAWLSRIQEMGIGYINTLTMDETAEALVALHESAQKADADHATFRRLIKSKFTINAMDPAERLFKERVMGLRANIGEEIADALWAGGYRSLFDLMAGMETEGQMANIAALPLRSSLKEGGRKRSIGPAAVARLKEALGL